MPIPSLNYTLHGFWGSRPETLEVTAARIAESIEFVSLLVDTGVWVNDEGAAVDTGELDQFVADLRLGVSRDDAQVERPGSGYTVHYRAGDWSQPIRTATELGKITVRTGATVPSSRSLAAGVIVTFDGESIASSARDHAEDLVLGIARIWQPEYAAFTDDALLELKPALMRFPSWAYVSWLSDRVSRGLDRLDGANSRRVGAGTLVATATWDPAQAAPVWDEMLASERISAASPVQQAQSHS